QDDGCRERGAPWSPSTASTTEPRRDREYQLADAMHDEGSLRSMPAETRRSGDRQGDHNFLLLQSGSTDGPCGLPKSCNASQTEHSSRKAVEPVSGLPAKVW